MDTKNLLKDKIFFLCDFDYFLKNFITDANSHQIKKLSSLEEKYTKIWKDAS